MLCQSPQPWYHWTGNQMPKPVLCYTCGSLDPSELLLCSAKSCSTKAYMDHRHICIFRMNVVTRVLLFSKTKALNHRGCLHDFNVFKVFPPLLDLLCLGGWQNHIYSGMVIYDTITYITTTWYNTILSKTWSYVISWSCPATHTKKNLFLDQLTPIQTTAKGTRSGSLSLHGKIHAFTIHLHSRIQLKHLLRFLSSRTKHWRWH